MIAFSENRLARIAELEDWHFWFAGRQAMLRRLWRRHVRGRCRVLDVGCGTGHTMRKLSDLGHWVVGMDARPEGLRELRRTWPKANVIQALAPHLPIADQTFDVVLMLDVLEHTDDDALLEQVRRVLRPRGWLILCVPALPWLWSYRDEAAGHLRRYARAQLRRLLAGAGFEALDMRFYQCWLMPVAVITRLLGRRSPGWRDKEEQPRPLLNRCLAAANRLEARLSDRIAWPIGTSLVAACQKP
jgi:SAM-dependent methyltransferase